MISTTNKLTPEDMDTQYHQHLLDGKIGEFDGNIPQDERDCRDVIKESMKKVIEDALTKDFERDYTRDDIREIRENRMEETVQNEGGEGDENLESPSQESPNEILQTHKQQKESKPILEKKEKSKPFVRGNLFAPLAKKEQVNDGVLNYFNNFLQNQQHKKQNHMEGVNKANHPCFIQSNDGDEIKVQIPVNCFDNILINKISQDIKSDEDSDPEFWSYIHQATINVKTMTVKLDKMPDQEMKLVRSDDENLVRYRYKNVLDQPDQNYNRQKKWPTQQGAYGKQWYQTARDGITYPALENQKFPTIKELMDGMNDYHCSKIDQNPDKSLAETKKCKENFRKVLNEIVSLVGIKDVEAKLQWVHCQDANCAEFQLIMYMYSIDPQFARDLAEKSRISCSITLMKFGPWARIMWGITGASLKTNDMRDDAFDKGADFMKNPLGAFSKTFLVYSGTLLNEFQILNWKELMTKHSKGMASLNGLTKTTRSLDFALEQTQCTTSNDSKLKPVLFVYSIGNKNGFNGFRLVDNRYTPFPHEQEYLMMEGYYIYVLDIVENFQVVNTNGEMIKYNNKKITVVYLQSYF